MNTHLLSYLKGLRSYNRKAFAVLIDPDKVSEKGLLSLIRQAESLGVDILLVGGSLLINDDIQFLIPLMKEHTDIPIILFPGSIQQVVPSADGILLLSLISGRNPDYLIGQHVLAAPLLKQSGLEILPTGYMLVESGTATTANYISNTLPIPYDKPDIAACTAMAGEMLGLQLMYLDGGSGAQKTVSTKMISAVSKNTQTPLIVGGGIRTAREAERIWNAGADLIVIGNAIERDPNGKLMQEIAEAKELKNKRKALQ